VFWSNSSTGSYILVGNASGTSFIDVAPTPGRTSYWKVSAVNSAGESSQSSAVSISSPADQVSALVARWYSNSQRTLVLYEFASNGKYYSFGLEEGTYSANNSGSLTLTRTPFGATSVYSYQVIGNVLVLSGTGGGLSSSRTYK
jgi:hypothetical protein